VASGPYLGLIESAWDRALWRERRKKLRDKTTGWSFIFIMFTVPLGIV
jgi:hypothetical protein